MMTENLALTAIFRILKKLTHFQIYFDLFFN